MSQENVTHKEIWERWNQSDSPKYPHEKVIQFVFRNFPITVRRETRVLDLGCGSGVHTVFLASEGFTVFASDISNTGILNTKKRLDKLGLKAEIRNEGIDEISFSTSLFDLVICCGVFDATGYATASRSVDQVARVLKKGGRGLFLFASDVDFRIQKGNSLGLYGYSEQEVKSLFSRFPWSHLYIDRYITTFENGSFQSNDFLVTLEK